MKMLNILLVWLLLVVDAGAADKIEGAFGLKLGESYQPSTPPVTSFNHIDGFAFTPKTPNPAFSRYVVFVTPKSHLIYRIVASGPAPDDETNRQAMKKVRAIVGKSMKERQPPVN